ncbi:MAG TPA: DUF1801 domain-containing protein [Pyrinomonadaceae bacterium]|nr:DUF1801 domain-containing protein [Pyrinomonadaceae bacterium]
MAEPKTKPKSTNVEAFLNKVPDEGRREDSFRIVEMMEEISGEEPKMWGKSIVGFGFYHYKYDSGREGDAPVIAFSPRKQDLTLYLMYGYEQWGDELIEKLGKYRTGKTCLYIKRLSDVHEPTLKKLIRESVKQTKRLNKPRPG